VEYQVALSILHIIPEDDVGGVELAAHSAAGSNKTIQLHFLKCSSGRQLRPSGENIFHSRSSSSFSPTSLREVINNIDRFNPELVVFSLWKSVAAFLLVKFRYRELPIVVLLHSERNSHFLDFIATWIMVRLASGIWVDSRSSINRVPKKQHKNVRVVSFLLGHTDELTSDIPEPNFVFWGRLTIVKNLPGSLRLFHEVKKLYPKATFTIIGPDDGELAKLQTLIKELKLQSSTKLIGYKPRGDIFEIAKNCSFFLQLSHLEGMAMSAAEAMQIGLVPVVTNVGEIGNYCRDMENAIIYSDTATTVGKIDHLLKNQGQFARTKKSALDTWKHKPIYADDFMAACQELLNK